MENVIMYTKSKLQQQNNKHHFDDVVSTSESLEKGLRFHNNTLVSD